MATLSSKLAPTGVLTADSIPYASQAQAEAGTNTTSVMNPLRTAQAINSLSFKPTTVTGTSQALDLSSYNFFDAGSVTADTTVSFTNVPTNASWKYSAVVDTKSYYDILRAAPGNAYNANAQIGGSPRALFIGNNGTKMYVSNATVVYQYTLSTPYDVTTATYDTKSYTPSQENNLRSITFNDDGTKFYVVGITNDTVYQYTLSTAWDISTATYDSIGFTVSIAGNGGVSDPVSVDFNSDGTRMVVVGNGTKRAVSYTLSTPYVVNTANYNSNQERYLDLSAITNTIQGATLSADGLTLYILENVASNENYLHEVALADPYDVSGGYFTGKIKQLESINVGYDLQFKSDGTVLYVFDDGITSRDDVSEYTVSFGIDISFPGSVQNPPTINSDAGQRVTYEFYTRDGGTNVYLINQVLT